MALILGLPKFGASYGNSFLAALSLGDVGISDIDSWNDWEINILDLIRNTNFSLLDGTFYDSKELENRNMDDVPHPLIKDSLKKFSLLELVDRKKVYFTHLNHTNPVIQSSSLERLEILNKGYNLAEDGMIFKM